MPPLSAEQVAAWRAYGEAQWGRLRLDLMRAFLDRHVALAPARVLDVGCGLAELALAYARAGSEVVATDPSGAMLTAAAERAGGEPGIRFLETAVEDAADALAGERFDLVLCHNVLGYVADPAGATAALASLLADGGHLSLTVANPVAEPLRAALMRHDLPAALAAGAASPTRRSSPTLGVETAMSDLEETCGWIESAGLEVVARAGHRILNDYLPPELKDGDGYDAILALELALCERDPYVRIAPFLHVLGRRG